MTGVMMSVETIRMALGRLQDDPDNESAWNDLAEAVTAPDMGVSNSEVERLLGMARGRHEQRREWGAVARLLDIEISFASGSAVEAPMQAELARIYQDELIDAERALAAYKRLLQLRPDDPTAEEAIENDEAKRAKWRDLVARYLSEAASGEGDLPELALRERGRRRLPLRRAGGARAEALENAEKALAIDRKNRRAAALAELAYTAAGIWENVARVQALVLADAGAEGAIAIAGRAPPRAHRREEARRPGARDGRVRAGARARARPAPTPSPSSPRRTPPRRSGTSSSRSTRISSAAGGLKRARRRSASSSRSRWSTGACAAKPAAAEPYFDRVRRIDPAHAGMLDFFREVCAQKGDKSRLATILSDAQRALPDGAEKRALATEIAKLAESSENAQKAIEQYKTVLRTDPENKDARDALRRLYTLTESWNALVEILRQELERTPATDPAARAAVLREIAAVYRDRVKNDAALVTVLTQIVQLDEHDVAAVRELTRVYEGSAAGATCSSTSSASPSCPRTRRRRPPSTAQRRAAGSSSSPTCRTPSPAYEALLEVDGTDEEAQTKLKELYLKRRSWPQLFALYERQLPALEGAAKIELLGEMAKLAAERLDRGAAAIALQKQILELDPQAAGVLDALEKQAEREKDFGTVAEVLERRIEAAADDAARLVSLQKLGAVYAERLKDPAAAARTWRRVLALSPGHAKALRVLRESYVAANDWDGLEELYASQSDWDGLVDFLSGAADKATEPAVKLDISFRAAHIFEEKLHAPERATRSYERVLSVSPQDARAAAALVPIYEKEEKWSRLPALYEVLLGASDDEIEKIAILRKLASVTGGPLADKGTALGYARRAYELVPDAEGLELLESWSRAAGSWGPFVEAVEARLKKADADGGLPADERRALRRAPRRGVRPRARQARRGGRRLPRAGRGRARATPRPSARSTRSSAPTSGRTICAGSSTCAPSRSRATRARTCSRSGRRSRRRSSATRARRSRSTAAWSRSRRATRPCARSRGSSPPRASTRPRPRSSPATAIARRAPIARAARSSWRRSTSSASTARRARSRRAPARSTPRPTTPRRSGSSPGCSTSPRRASAPPRSSSRSTPRSATAAASRRRSACASRRRRTRARAAPSTSSSPTSRRRSSAPPARRSRSSSARSTSPRRTSSSGAARPSWPSAPAARRTSPRRTASTSSPTAPQAGRRCRRPSRSSSASRPRACTTSSSATQRAPCPTSIASSRSTRPTPAPSTG